MKKDVRNTKARASRSAAPHCSVSARTIEKALAVWAIEQFPNLCGAYRKPNTELTLAAQNAAKKGNES